MMGSGSYGGSGGGGSGAGWGGGYSGGVGRSGTPSHGVKGANSSKNGEAAIIGPVTFDEDGNLHFPDQLDEHVVDVALVHILKRIPREYLEMQFCNQLVRSAYEQLFRLSVEIFQNKSWAGVAKYYGVAEGAECLRRWSSAVIAKYQAEEQNRKAQEVARVCLDDFLMLALDNDYDLFLSGSCNEVLRALNRKIFDSTSGYFLGLMIWRIVEREREGHPERIETYLRKSSQRRADKIIRSFEYKFKDRNQTTYRHLFRVICENFDWFLGELRRTEKEEEL
jgi:hypothetical protein